MLTVADLLRGVRPENVAHDPVAHLSACHRRIEQRLEILATAANSWQQQPAEAMAAIDGALRFFATNGVWHTEDEEDSVFPRLLPALNPEEQQRIATLEAEHAESDRLHAELERLAADLRQDSGSPGALAAFQACLVQLTGIYRRHIALEDAEIAPLMQSRLTAEQLAEIATEMRGRRQQP